MSSANPVAAELLEVSASAYAGFATSALLQDNPDIEARFAPGAGVNWRAHLAQRVRELAAAVGTGEPNLFLGRVNWTRRAFAARELSEEDLRAALGALLAVLREKLPETARDEACALLERALQALDEAPPAAETGLDPREPNQRLALEYLATVLEGNSRGAIERVLAAVDNGLGIPAAYLEVLVPAQREAGRLWHAAELDIAEEHFVTATTKRLMAVLAQRAPAAESNGKTVLAAAVAGNVHDVGVQVLADFFEMAGWRSVCLGGDVPAEEVGAAVQAFAADLLVLSAALSVQITTMRAAVTAAREHSTGTRILVGGLAFADAPDLWQQLGADGHVATIPEAVALGARLVGA